VLKAFASLSDPLFPSTIYHPAPTFPPLSHPRMQASAMDASVYASVSPTTTNDSSFNADPMPVKQESGLVSEPPKKKQKRNKPTLSCEECVERKTKVNLTSLPILNSSPVITGQAQSHAAVIHQTLFAFVTSCSDRMRQGLSCTGQSPQRARLL
jgi:hypothetical protein